MCLERNQELIDYFYKGLQALDIQISEATTGKFFRYKEMVLDWNNRINLTAILEDKEFIVKHFIDSLTLLPELSEDIGTMIDVGTGAGFPGIPIGILKPSLKITLMDSLEKRLKFLNAVLEDLELSEIKTLHSRAEDAGRDSRYREKYDCAVARAVASLPILLEYCLPFVKVGGTFFAMKGLSEDETAQAKKALSILGGEIIEVKTFDLPLTDNKRNIIKIKKIRQTPTNYPRKAGIPNKKPL